MYVMLIQQAAGEGLTLARIIATIPRDGPALFIYLLTAVSLWLIWQGSRTRDGREPYGGESRDDGGAKMEEAEVA